MVEYSTTTAEVGGMRHVSDHLAWCLDRNLRPRTIDARRGTLHRLRRAIATQLIDATRDDLGGWAHGLTLHLVPEARAVELSHANQFYRWAVVTELPAQAFVAVVSHFVAIACVAPDDQSGSVAWTSTRISPAISMPASSGHLEHLGGRHSSRHEDREPAN